MGEKGDRAYARYDVPGRNYDPTYYGGYSSDVALEGGVVGTSQEREVNRYRSMGEAAAGRDAYQLDWKKAQADEARAAQTRMQQREAVRMLGDAAHGNAPSAANILGGQVAGQSLHNALAAQAGARGPAAQGLAARQGIAAQGGQQLGGLGQFAGMRAGEMDQARGAHLGGAGTVRTQDYQQQALAQQRAEEQAKSEIFQRGLNQAGQMGYEQMGFDVNADVMNAGLRRKSTLAQINNTARANAAANRARTDRIVGGVISTGAAVVGAASDARAKTNLVQIGGEVSGRYTTSDDRAKLIATGRQAYLLGRSHQMEQQATGKPVDFAYGGAPKQGEQIVDQDPAHAAAERTPTFQRERPAGALEQAGQKVRGAVESAKKATEGALDRVIPGREKHSLRAADPMGNALADMQPYEYEYRDGFREAEGQRPGERNVGPMAQDMARNPITGSVVKESPDGTLMIDMPKATKLSLGGVGYLAQKQREQEERLAALEGRRNGTG